MWFATLIGNEARRFYRTLQAKPGSGKLVTCDPENFAALATRCPVSRLGSRDHISLIRCELIAETLAVVAPGVVCGDSTKISLGIFFQIDWKSEIGNHKVF